jgi:hypothetical protein
MISSKLLALYNQGGPYTYEKLASLYSADIRFRDPAHNLIGLSALCDYLNHQYSNVKYCEFISTGEWASGKYIFLQWDMKLQHSKLNSGRTITVNGLSQLKCQTQPDSTKLISEHRDYFDMGQLLYENVPLIGALNRRLKQGMSA